MQFWLIQLNNSLKYYHFIFFIFFIVTCDDIGKDHDWKGNLSQGFSRHFGTIGYDYGWSTEYSPFDQGIVIVGQRSPMIGSNSDLWAIKTDSRGLMEWEKSFGGSDNEAGYDVIPTSDGGFLFVGYTWSYGNKQQVYAIKTDFHGNKEWEKTYGGSMWDVGYSVIELSGGGYGILGFSNSPGISSGNTDMFLIKISSTGNVIWQKAYGNQAFPNHEWGHDFIQMPDLGFILVGARDRYDQGALNALAIRTDVEGNIIWEKEFIYEGQASEAIYSISKGKGGNYYLCTTTNSVDSPDVFQPKIINIDASGNIDWHRTYRSDSREYHQFRSTSTLDGDIIIVGSSSENNITGGYKEDAFMTKIDSEGNLIWTYPYGSADEDDWGWSVFESPGKNIIFVGSTKSFGSSLFDIFLVGTNSDGIMK